FQAEDGIRGFHVTGVQTCALPIFAVLAPPAGAVPLVVDRLSHGTSAGSWHGWLRSISLIIRAPLVASSVATSDVPRSISCTPAQIGRASCRERAEVPRLAVAAHNG